jgi:hypothetical protein
MSPVLYVCDLEYPALLSCVISIIFHASSFLFLFVWNEKYILFFYFTPTWFLKSLDRLKDNAQTSYFPIKFQTITRSVSSYYFSFLWSYKFIFIKLFFYFYYFLSLCECIFPWIISLRSWLDSNLLFISFGMIQIFIKKN